jgi:histidinol-phosphatase (PHP family)
MTPRVSIHGGHSGQFCTHGRDTLEQIVRAYIDAGFVWVGLTEHMPPASEKFLYPDELDAGLTVAAMQARFGAYMAEARRLQRKYADRIGIFVGFETEACSGALEQAIALRRRCAPDYVVGSLHHVDDRAIDYSPEMFQIVVAAAGGIEALYTRYFDQQYALIERLRPEVVGHFDLIRLFDPDYPRHLAMPAVWARIRRNLELIRRLDLILDYNLAALKKGQAEPYVSRPILELARDLGIALVPGDDAHSVDTVGLHLARGIELLQQAGVPTAWRKPVRTG